MGPKAAVMARLTKQQRRIERRKIGRLHDRVVTPQTLVRYRAAVFKFFAWVRSLGSQLPATWVGFDLLVSRFIEEAWQDGEPRALIGNLLSGLKFFVPPLKGRLSGGWRLHTAWGKHELPARAPPTTFEGTLAISGVLWMWQFIDAALGVILISHCLLHMAQIRHCSLTRCFCDGRQAYL